MDSSANGLSRRRRESEEADHPEPRVDDDWRGDGLGRPPGRRHAGGHPAAAVRSRPARRQHAAAGRRQPARRRVPAPRGGHPRRPHLAARPGAPPSARQHRRAGRVAGRGRRSGALHHRPAQRRERHGRRTQPAGGEIGVPNGTEMEVRLDNAPLLPHGPARGPRRGHRGLVRAAWTAGSRSRRAPACAATCRTSSRPAGRRTAGASS